MVFIQQNFSINLNNAVIHICYRSPYLLVHRHTRFGLLTNRNNMRFKQLTVQTNWKKESNLKQVLGVPVNISYHLLYLGIKNITKLGKTNIQKTGTD